MPERIHRVILTADTSGLQRGMQQAADSTKKVGDSADDTGRRTSDALSKAQKAVIGFAAVGLAAAAKGILDVGLSFEQSLNSMQAVTGATADEMGRVSDAAKKLGNDISIPGASASDAAEAMTELAKGGLSVKQSLSAARGTLQLATAAQISGAEAATIQADALNAFNLEASEAGHVADVLANAANAATGDIGDFGAGLGQSAAVAHAMGVSLDDTVTVLGLFANAGIKGSDAGTSLKTMFTQLQNPTDKAKTAMSELGLTVYDAQGNFVGMRTITDQLAKAQKTMSTEAFNAAAGTVFGSDAIRGATIVAQGGVAAYDNMSASLGKVGGAAQLAAAQSQGVNGALANVQNQLETVALSIFERFSPALESALNGVASALPAIGEFFGDTLSVIGGFIGLISDIPTPVLAAAAALGVVYALKGPLDGTWKSIKSGAETAALSLMVAKDGATNMGAAMGIAATGVKKASTAIKSAFLSNPIGIAIVGITTAVSLLGDAFSATEGEAVDLSSVIDEQSGKFRENAEAAVTAELGQKGLLTQLAAAGVNSGLATRAIIDQGSALEDLRSKLEDNVAAQQALADAQGYYVEDGSFFSPNTDGLVEAQKLLNDVNATIDLTKQKQREGEQAARDYDAAFRMSPEGAASFTKAGDAISAAREKMGNATTLAAGWSSAFEGAGSAAGNAAPSVETMGKVLDGVKTAASEADVKLGFLQLTLDRLNGRAPDIEAAARVAQAAIRGYVETYQGQAAAQEGVGAAQRAVTQAQLDYNEAVAKGTDENYTAEQKAIDVANAADAVAEAQRGVTSAQNDVVDSSDDLFTSGQDVYKGFLQQTQAAFDAAKESGNLAGAQDVARAKAQELRDAFIDQMVATGLSRDQAADLATKLGLIPTEVSTAVALVGGQDAFDLAYDFKAKLDAINGTQATAYLKLVQTGAAVAASATSLAKNILGFSANGSLWNDGVQAFAAGGFARQSMMGSGRKAIVWNEPETGWEAFISGKLDQRGRNHALMARTANLLGGEYIAPGAAPVRAFANGSLTDGYQRGFSSSTINNNSRAGNVYNINVTHSGPGEVTGEAIVRVLEHHRRMHPGG